MSIAVHAVVVTPTGYPAYEQGSQAVTTATFTLDGVATDPTAVTVGVEAPDKTLTLYTAGVDAQLVKDGTGAYHLTTVPALPGDYFVRWVGTGTVTAAGQGTFTARIRQA